MKRSVKRSSPTRYLPESVPAVIDYTLVQRRLREIRAKPKIFRSKIEHEIVLAGLRLFTSLLPEVPVNG